MSMESIGIFDSGVGGLTVAKEILAVASDLELVYFGDCLHVPYGGRSSENLAEISQRIIDFLVSKNIGALVVACGTISSKIFDVVKAMAPAGLPVFGMVKPGVRGVLETTKTGRVGIIATEGSIKAKTFENAILAAHLNAQITAVACPSFANLVEEGHINDEISDIAAQTYLSDFVGKDIDTLLLACTHYPILESSIKKALPRGVSLVDPAKFLALEIAALSDLRSGQTKTPNHQFYVSAKKDKFDKIAGMILGIAVDSVIARP